MACVPLGASAPLSTYSPAAAAAAAAYAPMAVEAEVKGKEQPQGPAQLSPGRVVLLQQCQQIVDKYKPGATGSTALARVYSASVPFTPEILTSAVESIKKADPLLSPITQDGTKIAVSRCLFYVRVVSGQLRIVGRAKLKECLLGKGTTGKVYKAWHFNLETVVAIKVSRKEKGQLRVRREYSILDAINCGGGVPGLASAPLDFFDIQQNRIVAIVMPLYKCSIQQLIKDQNTLLTRNQRLELCAKIVQGFQSLEQLNLWHGDIKPHNIMVDFQGNPIISDFEGAFALGKVTKRNFQRPETSTGAYVHPCDVDLLKATKDAKDVAAYKGVAKSMDRYAVASTLFTVLTSHSLPYPLRTYGTHRYPDHEAPFIYKDWLIQTYGLRDETLVKMLNHQPKERVLNIEEIVKAFCA